MKSMFYHSNSLKSIVGILDTTNLRGYSFKFSNFYSLTSINLSKFNTSKATSISNLFHKYSLLKEINVSNFNICKVIIMSGMFSGCS